MRALLGLVVGSQVADLGSTLYGFTRGSVEANPLLANMSTSELVIVKVATVALVLLAIVLTPKRWRLRVELAAGVSSLFVLAAAIDNVAIALR